MNVPESVAKMMRAQGLDPDMTLAQLVRGMAIDTMLNQFHRGIGNNTDGKWKPLPYTPNCVSTQTDQKIKKVDPLPFIGTLEESKKKILEVLANENQKVKIEKVEPNYIYCIYVSDGMKFKDDVEFYFDEAGQKIEFRSSSRTGFGDFGVNRQRYERIKAAYCG